MGTRAFDEGRMDAVMGREPASRYRRADKKRDYKTGYQQGLKEKQDEMARIEIDNMSEEEKIRARGNIQRIKNLLNR